MSKPIVVVACMLSSSESWEPQTAPTSLALTCRWRSRPQHYETHMQCRKLGSYLCLVIRSIRRPGARTPTISLRSLKLSFLRGKLPEGLRDLRHWLNDGT